jgi:hypothetical protein
MKMIAAQYFEDALDDATPAQVRGRLRQAFEVLPLSISFARIGRSRPGRLPQS